MADYDLIEGFNYNLSMEDFNIKWVVELFLLFSVYTVCLVLAIDGCLPYEIYDKIKIR